MFFSLSKGIRLAGGFSALTHFPIPSEPLFPSNPFPSHSPTLPLPSAPRGGLRVSRVRKEAPGRQGPGQGVCTGNTSGKRKQVLYSKCTQGSEQKAPGFLQPRL